MATEREQKLVDIMFEIALTISNTKYYDRSGNKFDMTKWSREKKVTWITDQLRKCGFDTYRCGSSWGILK
jgi:hypothetical protein